MLALEVVVIMNPIVTELTKRKPNLWKAYIQGHPSIFEEGENETVAIARLLLRLQGKSVRTWNGAFMLSVACWLSVIVTAWLVISGNLIWGEVWGFWIFFLILAILSGAYAGTK